MQARLLCFEDTGSEDAPSWRVVNGTGTPISPLLFQSSKLSSSSLLNIRNSGPKEYAVITTLTTFLKEMPADDDDRGSEPWCLHQLGEVRSWFNPKTPTRAATSGSRTANVIITRMDHCKKCDCPKKAEKDDDDEMSDCKHSSQAEEDSDDAE